jgi:hypothetical protein
MLENETKLVETPAKPPKLKAFRRTQLVLGWWGLLLLIGGSLHNMNSSPKAWGFPTVLAMWIALNVVGFLVTYWLQPTMLRSGILFVWLVLTFSGLFLTWLIVFPLNNTGRTFVSAIWHLVFVVGYWLTGYYMDRRLWWLAAWEGLVAALMLILVGVTSNAPDFIANNLGLTLGLSSGIPLLIAAVPIWKRR